MDSVTSKGVAAWLCGQGAGVPICRSPVNVSLLIVAGVVPWQNQVPLVGHFCKNAF